MRIPKHYKGHHQITRRRSPKRPLCGVITIRGLVPVCGFGASNKKPEANRPRIDG